MNEAELVLTDILNCSRLMLRLNGSMPLERSVSSALACVLKRRIKAEPLQYILGETEFMGLAFKVDSRVLIPRPETEIIVERALELSGNLRQARILDMGTGSGCIAVSLAKLLPAAFLTGTDISAPALEVAQYNARFHKAEERIRFIESDLFAAKELQGSAFDLIVSNPPYIRSKEIDRLQPEIQYEPRLALDGGVDGLEYFRRIIREAPSYLKPQGLLVLEMGLGQRKHIEGMLRQSKAYKTTEVIRDYNGIARVIVARKQVFYG